MGDRGRRGQHLLKPQYKGKITLNDPSVSGAGISIFPHLALNLWGEEKAVEFLRQLLKEQEVAIQRDNRLHVETVARGKYAIGFGPAHGFVAQFLAMGAPIKVAEVEEDNRISTGTGAMGVPATLAHPNAARLFVNWLLTKEGQEVYAASSGAPGTRTDTQIKDIDPVFVPVLGKKYFMETEEEMLTRGKWLGIARRIIEETAK